MNKIKLEKRKPTFDYILNDLAFDSLMFRVVNGIGSSQDKFDFDYQIKLIQQENERLRTALNGSEEKRKKTIEYIKSNYIDNPIEFKDDLLKILKGSDK